MIFEWKNIKNWSSDVLHLISDRFSDDVIGRIKKDDSDFYDPTNSDWLDKLIKHKIEESTLDVLYSRLVSTYSKLRVYHACSPSSIDSYLENGFQTLNPKKLKDETINLFLSFGAKVIDINNAIADVSTNQRAGRIYFSLDDRDLINFCGHYLVYGSEYIISIAASLYRKTNIDYRTNLKLRGKPTIFLCDIPMSLLSSYTVRELAGAILTELAWFIRNPRIYASLISFGFSIDVELSPKVIVDWYHPRKIKDPLSNKIIIAK